MSPTVAADLKRALAAVDAERMRQDVDWTSLYVLAGRAFEAADRQDEKATRKYIEMVCDLEHALCGDCDRFGGVLPPDE